MRDHAVVSNDHAVKTDRSGALRRVADAIAPLSALLRRLGADVVQKVLLSDHSRNIELLSAKSFFDGVSDRGRGW